MTGVSEGKYGGLLAWANVEWRKWVDTMHGQHNPSKVPLTAEQSLFVDMWYPPKGNADTISERTMSWKYFVQQAFFDGYQAGFTSRILNGETNGNE